MIQNIIIVAVVIILLIAAFFIGVWVGIGNALYICEKEAQKSEDRYCFDCDIETPAIEKNGRFYCANCKLYH